MSRSYKQPYLTDRNSIPKSMKKVASKKFRKLTSHLFQNSLYKKLYENWQVRYCLLFCPDKPKAYRK